MKTTKILALAGAATLAGCGGHDGAAAPGDADDTKPFAGIAPNETIQFTGTEPFWGGETSASSLTYTTPEDQQGSVIAVERFAGRNGVSISGELDGKPFVMAVTPGTCNDGMSDRDYPYTVTLQVRGEQRNGCAWTADQPYTGPKQP
jgi:uncharacterized membrane protein